MGFFSDMFSKISDVWKPIISKVSDGVKWVASKVSPVIDAVKSGINYASNLPIIGTAVQALKNTPIGQGISSIGSGLSQIADTINGPKPVMDYNVD